MHLSRYLKVVEPAEPDGEVLLYSCRRTSLVRLPAMLFAALQRGEADAATVRALKKLGMLVEDQEAERVEVHNLPAALNRLNPTLRLAVVVGMRCNFACRYCYEGDLKGDHAMDDAVAAQLLRYVGERLSPSKKRLIVDFYGGEPLLYMARIISLCQQFKALADRRGVSFQATLVSNGSLLTGERAAELAACGVTAAKVTIDGPAEVHDRSRPFRNGRGSFATIVANLRAAHHTLKLTLAGNFTATTWRQFPLLLDYLAENGLGPVAFAEVKFDAAMQINDVHGPADFREGTLSTEEPWLVEACLVLRREIRRRGYTYPRLQPSTCMIEQDDNIAVHFNGDLYKCVALVGREAFRAGDLRQGIVDGFRRTYCCGHWRANPACGACAYLPLCFGGCRFLTYQRTGAMAGVDCQKAYFDRALVPMLLDLAAT
ncbi:MAG: geopeptide radical SAM maturase [Thermodesulfobacteriota bacterium]